MIIIMKFNYMISKTFNTLDGKICLFYFTVERMKLADGKKKDFELMIDTSKVTLVKKTTHGVYAAKRHSEIVKAQVVYCAHTSFMCWTGIHRHAYAKTKVYVHLWCLGFPIRSACAHAIHILDNLMVSSDIEMSYFKGFSSKSSRLWYLKQLPRVLECWVHTLTYTLTQIHSPALQQKYTDWSQCRAIERKRKKNYRKEIESFFFPFWEFV